MAIDQGPSPDGDRWERLYRNADVEWYVDRLRKLVTETKEDLASGLNGHEDWQSKYRQLVAHKEALELVIAELTRGA